MRNDFSPKCDFGFSFRAYNKRRRTVLLWEADALTAHDTFRVFLTGTLVSSSPSSYDGTRTNCKRRKLTSQLVMLNGKAGLLELILEYSDNPNAQDLHPLRQLTDLWPPFIKNVPSENSRRKRSRRIKEGPIIIMALVCYDGTKETKNQTRAIPMHRSKKAPRIESNRIETEEKERKLNGNKLNNTKNT